MTQTISPPNVWGSKMTIVDLLIYRIFSEDITGPLAHRYKRLMRTCLLKKTGVEDYYSVQNSWQTLEAVVLCFNDLHQEGSKLPLTLKQFLGWAKRDIESREFCETYEYEKTIDAAVAYFTENPKTHIPETVFDKVVKIGIAFAQHHAAREYDIIAVQDAGSVRKGDFTARAGLKDAIEEQQRLIAKIARVYEEDSDDVQEQEVPASAQLLNDEMTLEFPDYCLYGKLGEYAKQLNMPLGLAYPALGVCYSVKPNIHTMDGTRINLYGALIAEVGHGKDQSIERAIQMLRLENDRDYGVDTIGGDFQLAQVLGSKSSGKGKNKVEVIGPAKRLLITQEIGDVLIKTGAEGSTLAKRLQYLWDHNEYSKPDRQGKFSINCRLSWLGGVTASEETPEEFTNLFGSGTTKGLYSRFIFGYSGKKWKWEKWKCPNKIPVQYSVPIDEMPVEELARKHKAGCTLVEGFAPATKSLLDAAYHRWEDRMLDPGRLIENAKRWAIITASANDEETVTADCMAKALTFMDWQAEIRKKFLPSIADDRNPEAQFANMFLPAFAEDGAGKKFLQPWKTVTDRHWHRKRDGRVMMTAIENLITMGVLIPEAEEDDRGRDKRGRRGKFPRCKINPKHRGR